MTYAVPESKVFHSTVCWHVARSRKMQALISTSGLRECRTCQKMRSHRK